MIDALTSTRTFDVSLFTKLCKSSRETLAGRLTAGAKADPSSSDTNWTTTFGDCSTGTFSGSGMPLYTFCRLGGGSNVAMKIFRWAALSSQASFWKDPDSSGLRYHIRSLLTRSDRQDKRRWGRPSLSTSTTAQFRDQLSNMTKIELRENIKRGGGQSTDWLQAKYTFAVPPCVPMNRCGVGVLNRVGCREYLADGLESFGRLRIINEDRIKAHNGFGFHSHKGLEIFTYMVRGELKQ
jgi:hypothetical protein